MDLTPRVKSTFNFFQIDSDRFSIVISKIKKFELGNLLNRFGGYLFSFPVCLVSWPS